MQSVMTITGSMKVTARMGSPKQLSMLVSEVPLFPLGNFVSMVVWYGSRCSQVCKKCTRIDRNEGEGGKRRKRKYRLVHGSNLQLV